MSPALARIKRAVRKAIGHSGGIDGAAATVERSRSTVGDWNNLNTDTFPPLDCAFAMDEIAVAEGQLPPVICAMARELGGVFVPAIDVGADEGSPAFLAMQLAQTLGEVSGEIARSLADDNRIDHREAARCSDKLHAHNRIAAQLQQQLEKILKEGE
ncbi:hypothetical protein FHW96_000211 [Novosphingobium sp. SG751A]|uniref:phage regulatory CII family protein n=1 Tax=Novosphingobium sp. SG751A TaxID=2587000 RepID=UPI0015571FE2|nr:phage regulatory CII family protein [Novosphingobium sp. SG751A]NOW44084.1 hypothetical protein [Novosphingobium sp. SG751A]